MPESPDPTAVANVAVDEALQSLSLLNRAAGEALALDALERGLTPHGLAETGLVVAEQGFERLGARELSELGTLVGRVQAGLSPAERRAVEYYRERIRRGDSVEQAEADRALELLRRGFAKLPAGDRERLQALYAEAIASSLRHRREAEGRTREAMLAPPPPSTTLPRTLPAPGLGAGGAILDPRTNAPRRSGELPAAEAPAGSPSPAASPPGEQRGEAYWRGRAARARSAVKTAEKQVGPAEERVQKALALAATQPGCTPPTVRSISELKEMMKTYRCTPSSDVALAQQALDRVRADFEAARKALDDLDDEARHANALPGWLREY